MTNVVPDNMEVGIVGGGVAGLACAYRLANVYQTGSVLFDTGKKSVGGRCSSKLLKKSNGDPVLVDHACQIFSISENEIMKEVLRKMEQDHAVTKVNGIFRYDKTFSLISSTSRQFYAGNSQQGINSICQWLLKGSGSRMSVHENVWISKLKRNLEPKLHPTWTLKGKRKGKDNMSYGPYKECVIAHNGKCADRLIRTSNVKTQANPILKCKFVAAGSNKTLKHLELKSLFVVIVELEGYDTDMTGCFIENNPTLSFVMNNCKKYNRQGKSQIWTLISSAVYASKNKCPQENIPTQVRKKVGKEMYSEFLTILQEYIEMKHTCPNTKEEKKLNSQKKQQHSILHVQLWGAALPCNTIVGEPCVYDSDNHIGVIGDWFLKPSIEGSILSGFALADVVGNKILKERHRKTPIAFAKYSCSDIGSFEGLQQGHPVVAKALEHKKKVERNKRKKKGAKQSNKVDMLKSKATADGTKGQKKKTNSAKKKKQKNVRPNFFLSVRIKNDTLKGRAQHTIDLISLLGDRYVSRCAIPTRDLHLTLFVFNLSSEKAILEAKNILECCSTKINSIVGRAGINLSFANVGTFRNDVVFVEVVKNEGYKKFFNVAKLLYSEFANADLLLHKDAPFQLKPHVTLLKTSKVRFKKGEKRCKIRLKVPNIVKHRYFGTCTLDQVELSAMQIKDKDGYYACKGFVSMQDDVEAQPNLKSLKAGDDPTKLLLSLENAMIAHQEMQAKVSHLISAIGKSIEYLQKQR